MLYDISTAFTALRTAMATPPTHTATKDSPAIQVMDDVSESALPPRTLTITLDRVGVEPEDGYEQTAIIARNMFMLTMVIDLGDADPEYMWSKFEEAHRVLAREGWYLGEATATAVKRSSQVVHLLQAEYSVLSA